MRRVIDCLLDHLNNRIQETEEAIAKWTAAIERDDDFIVEFSVSDPEVAQIYRDWKVFDQDKETLFQGVLHTLKAMLEKRKGCHIMEKGLKSV